MSKAYLVQLMILSIADASSSERTAAKTAALLWWTTCCSDWNQQKKQIWKMTDNKPEKL